MGERAVVLVGHGGVPSDFPRAELSRLKVLEGRRQAERTLMSEEERSLDDKLRGWPRSDATDPYRAGLERIARALAPRLDGVALYLAYNEFCAPSIEQAIAHAIREGAREVTVVPSMVTPGGVHSEREIPQVLALLRDEHPEVVIRYAWPFSEELVAELFTEQLRRRWSQAEGPPSF